MKKQSTSWWCGVASIANALEVLGIRRSQREIARICAVSPEAGTDEVEMKRALLANGVQVDEYQTDNLPEAWRWLHQHVNKIGPTILCVDNWEHWVTVIGVVADRFVLFDPARNQGVEVHGSLSLQGRWRHEETYYGIGVWPAAIKSS
jgi:ABC-type bacteriocin/lantibiotic exporter with double-glycine peptidase domain